ncbi:hypothetical protein SAMN05216474_0601 [Lishizhenia tianjinensis]|uniref:Lipocalin-like domain-containing protein n=1 Tax=Lishizhenia tianjinensis TaxID=477690 RepID=A0A1I6Y1Z3_9FLAO|nr:hypothetical protein [Lishizhenia tianjinensis]SFT44397.1 hypothetical protein SAMN05216474_0601 [Lishizhenia tianjinensis]
MKRSFLFVLGASLVLGACSKSKTTQKEMDNLKDSAMLGDWTVSKMIDSGDDETSNFQGYIFSFNEDGTLVATNNVNTYNGTWSVTSSDSGSDDDSSDDSDIDFNIAFNVPESNDFDDLIDDWDVLSHSDNKIELQDISGGNGGTDLLTFTR